MPYDARFNIEPEDEVRAVFWGLGSDGTVSANKNSIKIIGEETSNYAQNVVETAAFERANYMKMLASYRPAR